LRSSRSGTASMTRSASARVSKSSVKVTRDSSYARAFSVSLPHLTARSVEWRR
jgi:hypothetical protein